MRKIYIFVFVYIVFSNISCGIFANMRDVFIDVRPSVLDTNTEADVLLLSRVALKSASLKIGSDLGSMDKLTDRVFVIKKKIKKKASDYLRVSLQSKEGKKEMFKEVFRAYDSLPDSISTATLENMKNTFRRLSKKRNVLESRISQLKLSSASEPYRNDSKSRLLVLRKDLDSLDSEIAKKEEDLISRYSQLKKKIDALESGTSMLNMGDGAKMMTMKSGLSAQNNQEGDSLSFSIAPFVGVYVPKSDDYRRAFEYGGIVQAPLNDYLAVSVGMSFYNSTQFVSTKDTNNKKYSMLEGRVIAMAPKNHLLRPYIFGGAEKNIQDSDSKINLLGGAGLAYTFSPELDFWLDGSLSKEAVHVKFGFRRVISPGKGEIIYRDKVVETVVASTGHASNKINIKDIMSSWSEASDTIRGHLEIINQGYVYAFASPNILDMKNHWAYSSAYYSLYYGIMEGKKEGSSVVFYPKQPMKRVEAAHLLSLAKQARELFKKRSMMVEYEFTGLPSRYFLTIQIKLPSGKIVRTLLKRKVHLVTGRYQASWDMLSDEGGHVKPGRYDMSLTIEKMIDTDKSQGSKGTYTTLYEGSSGITVEKIDRPKIENPETKMEISDVPVSDPYYLAVQNVVQDGLFKLERRNNLNFFHPQRAVTRLEFMVFVGQLLVHLGADGTPEGVVKFDLFLDAKEIKNLDKGYLSVYAYELGYGGDASGKLMPDKVITRAEAAVIMKRLFEWFQRNQEKESTKALKGS